jgi:HD-like signal output (HDOD) protein
MSTIPAIIAPTAPPDERRIRQAIARLRALPAFYPTIQKVLHLLDDPLSTTGHLQQMLSSDQAIAARVLKLANSAYFGFHSQVRTVSLAVTLVGRDRVRTLLHRFLADELTYMLSGRRPAAAQIRDLSLATAAAARAIAERALPQHSEELLVAGLLHNVGDHLLLSQFRERYETMLDMAEQMPRAEAEKSAFAVESRLAGRWLLEAWEFPKFFCDIVEHWESPWATAFPATPVPPLAAVHGARRLAEALLQGQKAEAPYTSFSQRLLSTLDIDRSFLLEVYLRLPQEVERLKGGSA